jgi:uncharacterized protein (DUF58 family)
MKVMKHPKNGWRVALLVVGISVLAVLVMDFNSRMAELRRLTAEREIVRERMEGLERTQAALQTQIVYATSEAAVNRWAYEDGHMVRPGDNPVVPVAPSNVTPAPTPTPAVTPVAVSNWQRWLSLFIGPRANAP